VAALDALPEGEPRRSHPVLTILPALVAVFRNDDKTALARLAADGDHPDPWMAATAHLLTGFLQINLGEADAAEGEFDQALARFRDLGERWGAGQALVARADLAAIRGHHEQAMATLDEAMEMLAGLGDREDVGQILIRRAGERARAGQVDEAEADLAAADRLAHEVGVEDQKLHVSLTRADLARWQGRLEEARTRLEEALAVYRRGSFPVEQVHAIALVGLGFVEVAAGDLAAARSCHDQALRAALATRDRPVIARVTVLGAAVAQAGGDPGRAAELLGVAETLRGMPDQADLDLRRITWAARAALGDPAFDRAHRRGAAQPREEVLAALAAEVSSAAGTPAGPAGPPPPR
jgi:tetratricopeptide (TPR) repeat protein